MFENEKIIDLIFESETEIWALRKDPIFSILKIDISNYEDPWDNYKDPKIISEHVLKPSILRKNGIENID